MPSLFLALVGAALASLGGRDQRLIAQLSAKLGASGALLAVAWISAAATSSLAAVAGVAVAAILPPAAKTMLAAIALILGGLELAWPWKVHEPAEPTRSLLAILIVLFSQQIGDGVRFLVLAVAVVTGNPLLAAVGGALGSGAVVTAGWAMGSELEGALPLRTLRLGAAALLVVIGIVIGTFARGVV